MGARRGRDFAKLRFSIFLRGEARAHSFWILFDCNTIERVATNSRLNMASAIKGGISRESLPSNYRWNLAQFLLPLPHPFYPMEEN
jgi:hypothetical protein